MKRLQFLAYLFSFSTACLSQEANEKYEVKNLLSITSGGTPTTLGITYERIFNNRKVSLEIGTGLLLGGGLGVNFYPFKPIDHRQLNFFFGVRSGFNVQGSGGSRIVSYLPVGVYYLGSKKLYLSFDLGPAYIVQLVPNGYIPFDQPQPHYPKGSVRIYGGLKVGFGF